MIREIDYEHSTSVPTAALAPRTMHADPTIPIIIDVARAHLSAAAIGLIGGISIGTLLFALGYIAGALGPMRGWAALLVFAVVLAAVTIRGRNTR